MGMKLNLRGTFCTSLLYYLLAVFNAVSEETFCDVCLWARRVGSLGRNVGYKPKKHMLPKSSKGCLGDLAQSKNCFTSWAPKNVRGL